MEISMLIFGVTVGSKTMTADDIKGPFIATQLNSTSSWVELRRYKRALTQVILDS